MKPGQSRTCVDPRSNSQSAETFELLWVGYRQLWKQDAVPDRITGAFADEVFDCRNEGIGGDRLPQAAAMAEKPCIFLVVPETLRRARIDIDCCRDAAGITVPPGIGKRRFAARKDTKAGDLGEFPRIGKVARAVLRPMDPLGKGLSKPSR